jgi:SAM-dependent methyltransferase
VTSTDYVGALLDRGAERAHAERLDMRFQVADAEALPFEDVSFDAVLSTFGVMFTPNQGRAAAELARVCRPGGRIGLANWTPGGFIGQLFKTLGRHLPPPADVPPPSRWGVAEHLQILFADAAVSVRATPREFNFRYRSPAHFIEVFRTWYGPVHKAFAALPAEGAAALEADITALLERLNVAGPDSLVVPSAYLEVVVTRR